MRFSEYSRYDATGLAELVRNNEVTPKELKDTAVEAIRELNPKLNAVNNVLAESGQEIEGSQEGPFAGVPFLIKEALLHAENVPSNLGSRLAEGLVYSDDTELMTRFKKAGLVTVGTTTTPEWAYNATTESIFYGPTRNPWNMDHSPGGSSGGAGAAVAAGIVPIAHANDGGGSIRIPASCNGLIGLKPTRGRTPTGPFGELLSGIGVEFAVSRSVRDTAALLDAVSGPDIGAYSFAPPPNRSFLEAVTEPPKRLRIAFMEKPLTGVPVNQECINALRETAALCQELGHEVVEASPQIDVELHNLATLRIWTAHVAHMVNGVAKALNRVPSEENLETASFACYQYGQAITAPQLLEATDIMAAVTRSVGRFFTEYDILLSPTTAQPPLPLGELNQNALGINAEQWTEQIFTYAPFTNLFNTTGQPAISLPLAWSSNGLPIGMQFGGRFADESTLINLASQLEQARPWKDKRPPALVNASLN
ncbi:amidase [Fictibacillus enclensis]|uniref:amidase n=1 Tax=Fictibacillus enclensis TaxID=1017270 RepID=UPI0024BF144C|nr:amidase family protein [Fictibacillus enclensis]WHY74529.1 amidase family protein [Fictibacillus enclensis]